jgi:hypothetical protein
MPAREFYCAECRSWRPIDPGEGVTGSRRRHAEEHTAAHRLFSSDGMAALDLELESFYQRWYG